MATKTKTKAKAKQEQVDEEVEDLELEDLEEDDEEPEAKPKAKSKSKSKKASKSTKAKANKAPEKPEVWGTRQLSEYIEDETGKAYKPKELRVLLRKMADEGEIEWEVKQGSGSRYSWDGPDDPEVQAVLEYVEGGAIEEARQEALDKLKKQQEAKRKTKGKSKGKKATSKKKKAEPEPEPEDLDDDELEELDDEEE